MSRLEVVGLAMLFPMLFAYLLGVVDANWHRYPEPVSAALFFGGPIVLVAVGWLVELAWKHGRRRS